MEVIKQVMRLLKCPQLDVACLLGPSLNLKVGICFVRCKKDDRKEVKVESCFDRLDPVHRLVKVYDTCSACAHEWHF